MQDIQEIFSKIKAASKEQSEIRKEYKDALAHDMEYTSLMEELSELRDKKKKLEEFAQGQMGSRYERLEDLKGEVAEYKQMLSDIAVTSLMNGTPVEVKDEYDNIYEPSFNVTFKKSDAKSMGSEMTQE